MAIFAAYETRRRIKKTEEKKTNQKKKKRQNQTKKMDLNTKMRTTKKLVTS